MKQKPTSLRRTVLLGTLLFMLLLCSILSVAHLHSNKRMLYGQCEARIADILHYVQADIDTDDLAECIRTGVESERYRELQAVLDQMRNRLDIHFIYIIEPLNTDPVDNIRNVIAGASEYEYEYEPESLVKLNSLTGDSYSPETAKKYLNAYRSGELSFFEEVSEWGDDYTGLLPLFDSEGRRVAALCVDVDFAWMRQDLRASIAAHNALIILLGVGFLATFLYWVRRTVTRPIEQLAHSVDVFASKCRDQTDPEALKLDVPDLPVQNEVATLAGAVSEMSEAMQEYVKGRATAELAARDAETIAELSETITNLFNYIPGLSFSKDAESGVYLACNQGFADYAHKARPEDVVGLTDAEIFDAETAAKFVQDDRMAQSMDQPYIFFEDVPDAVGNMRQLKTTKLKYVDSNGRLCLLGMCTDMTDNRAQARANRMITAMASDYRCVYYVDLDEDDGVCYRDDPNDSEQTPVGIHFPYLERFKWYAAHSVSERYREGFLHFISPENIRARLAEQPIIAYRYLVRRQGREYYEMIRAAGVRRASERDDHIVHAIGLGLTEIDAEMRESMAKNEALVEALTLAEEASKAKTAFLSSMSHEIRTPMNAIIGLDSLALKKENLDGETREYLEKIGASARHLLTLINDILDMSRIESGRMVLQQELFSFSAMLEQINSMVLSQCGDKGLHYTCQMLSSVDDAYIGDDMKLKEVILNILSNAVKFTDAPGSVTMTVERTAVFEELTTLRFCIRDTGIGMEQEFLPRLFEPFSQEDSTTKNRYGSTGLGMAITKNLVEMMNGTISVTSQKGVGTEFTVVVTLRNAPQEENALESEIDPKLLRVLVVDDEEIAAEHARMVLDEAGIRAEVCLSGAEALRMMEVRHLKQEPYNLVLVDWKMPEQDGIDTAREIRTRYSSETTVILLTAYNWDEIREAALHAGVDGFLAKPLFASSVLNEVGRIARRSGKSLFQEKGRAELAGRHVLLAEDIEINAEILIDILDMEEMTADHAENGKIAVDLFRDNPPGTYSAILMDVRMPVMDGLEATEAIRALDRPDAKTIPIIALTANAFDEDVQRSLQAGMNAHLTKPVEPDHLYRTMEELIYEAEMKG